MDNDATKFIAGFLGLPYGSSLYVKETTAEGRDFTQILEFDSSGLDISSLDFFQRILEFTAKTGIRGRQLLQTLGEARLVKGRDVIYESKEAL